MDSKWKIIIAWRFHPEISEISLAKHCIKPKAVGEEDVPEDIYQDILNELKSSTSNLTAFVHKPNTSDKIILMNWQLKMDKLKECINREKSILVLEFGSGSGAVYTEFIDQINYKLKNDEITSDNVEEKLSHCIQSLDTIPNLIQVHKWLILAKLQNEEVIYKLNSIEREDKSLEDAIDELRDKNFINEEEILNYISNEVVKYGA